MSIDWFTFTAQIVNFLILIWLLKRFLYGPIIRAMTEREQHIAERFLDAEKAHTRADASERDYQNRLQELDQTKETLIAKAGQDVAAWQTEQLQQAKAHVEDNRRKWQQDLSREKDTLLRELQLDVAGHTVELGRHVLSELADQRLESRLVDRFIDQLAHVDRESHGSIGTVSPADSLIVETAHELADSDRVRIISALSEFNSNITFHVNPQLICGIELQTPGCKFAWNIRESLAEVESDLIDSIENTLYRGNGRISRPTKGPSSEVAAT